MRDPVLHEALMRRGAVTAIAKACEISTAAVSRWDRVPAERVKIVAEVTGVAPHLLRPDVVDAPAAPPAPASAP